MRESELGEESSSLEKENKALTEESLAKDKKAPIERSLETGKEKEVLTPPQVNISFSQLVRNEQQDKQFSKFLEMLKKLHINVPFTEAIGQIPKYEIF